MHDPEEIARFDPFAAVALNRQRLEARFVEATQRGMRWLVECRDLSDAYDEAAGVYFEECADDTALWDVIERCTEDNAYDRLLGIFDLQRPLAEQADGQSRTSWLASWMSREGRG